jgi:hypothetical protein
MVIDTPLPENLRPYFWDYPCAELSLKTDENLIIRRILTNGSWDSVLWLRSQVGDHTLKEWLMSHRGRGLSARQLRFWGLILDLPIKQIDIWVQAASETHGEKDELSS